MGQITAARLPARAAIAAAALALSTGAGLLAYFISRIALPLGVAVAFLATGTTFLVVWRKLPSQGRIIARSRAWAGLRAAAVATMAYDLTRFVAVHILGLHVNPFAALPLFGQALIGQTIPGSESIALGAVLHIANGIGFGIAYTMVAARAGVLGGVVWALLLEALMLALYPGWLDIRAYGDFFSMSIMGHLAYGATLGWLSRRLVPASALMASAS